jgi:hypothetical protein
MEVPVASRNVKSALLVVIGSIAAILATAVVVQAMMLYQQGWRVAWGTMPEWLAAFGGAATVGTLILAWLVYQRDKQHREADQRAFREEKRREQAELITAYLNDHIEVGLEPSLEHYVRLDLFNASLGVVYDVFVRILAEPDDPISAGGAAPEHREARGYMHVLPPSKTSTTMRMPNITRRVMGLELYFRDARNQRWMRDTSGMLKSTNDDPFAIVRDAFWRVKAAPFTKPRIEIQILHPDVSS